MPRGQRLFFLIERYGSIKILHEMSIKLRPSFRTNTGVPIKTRLMVHLSRLQNKNIHNYGYRSVRKSYY